MSKKIKLTEEQLRDIIADVINEDMMPPKMHPSTWNSSDKAPPSSKSGAKSGVPNLKAFKADCGMMADAANKVKQILDSGQGNTKEALRWLDKVIQFAQSAKGSLS